MSKKIVFLLVGVIFGMAVGWAKANAGGGPIINSITPAYGSPGQTVALGINGLGFTNQVNFSGCGINPVSDRGFQLISCGVDSDSSITATYYISPSATFGSRDISLAHGDSGVSNSVTFNIMDSSYLITLSSPYGDENWYAGNTYSIKWNQNFSGETSIDLLKGGSLYMQLRHGGPSLNSGDHIYGWPVPSAVAPGNDYSIRVSIGDVQDVSDSFIISEAPYVPIPTFAPTIVSPVNGAVVASIFPSLEWASISGAQSYQYNIYDSSGSQLYSWTTNPSGDATKKTQIVTSLADNSTYKWRVRACSQSLSSSTNASDSTCGPWSGMYSFTVNTSSRTLSFSQSSFNFSYTRGGAIPASQSLTFTNTTNSVINFTISVNNQPAWLDAGYNTGQLISNPGVPVGLGASVAPSNLAAGVYTASVVIAGSFTGSPINIPVILSVADPSAASILDGGLIRANNGIDVWIVKYINGKQFKRLILSPSVFNSYGHLHWSDIKVVDPTVADSFTTSDLVRAVNDTKVYKLTPSGDSGQRQWVQTQDAFTIRGLDWDAIYQINQADRDSYVDGQALN